jgi:hypothetical protein
MGHVGAHGGDARAAAGEGRDASSGRAGIRAASSSASERLARRGNATSAVRGLRLLTLLLATAIASACGNVDVSWKEEVKLADGRIIVVVRTAEGKALGEIGGPGGWRATRMTLEIDHPKVPQQPPRWSERWVPMLLDYDKGTGEWFLVATFYTCIDWYDLGRPRLPYLQYRAREGRWEEVPLDPKLYGRPANMLTGVNARGEPGLVDIDAKERRKRNAAEEFRRIVDVWPTSC